MCFQGIKKMSFFRINFAGVKMASHLRRFFGYFFMRDPASGKLGFQVHDPLLVVKY